MTTETNTDPRIQAVLDHQGWNDDTPLWDMTDDLINAIRENAYPASPWDYTAAILFAVRDVLGNNPCPAIVGCGLHAITSQVDAKVARSVYRDVLGETYPELNSDELAEHSDDLFLGDIIDPMGTLEERTAAILEQINEMDKATPRLQKKAVAALEAGVAYDIAELDLSSQIFEELLDIFGPQPTHIPEQPKGNVIRLS